MSTRKLVVTCIVLGDTGVGKSSLISRLLSKASDVDASFTTCTVVAKNEEITFRFVESADAEHDNLRDIVFSGNQSNDAGTVFLNGCILVYDVTNAASFAHLSEIHSPYITNHCQPRFMLCVGAQRDRDSSRQVPSIEAEMVAAEQGWVYLEASSLESQTAGVDLAFVHLCARARTASASLFKRLQSNSTSPAPAPMPMPTPISAVSSTVTSKSSTPVPRDGVDLQVLERELQQISTALENDKLPQVLASTRQRPRGDLTPSAAHSTPAAAPPTASTPVPSVTAPVEQTPVVAKSTSPLVTDNLEEGSEGFLKLPIISTRRFPDGAPRPTAAQGVGIANTASNTMIWIVVNIGDGRAGRIEVCDGDNALHLAQIFLLHFALDRSAFLKPLADTILARVQAYSQQKARQASTPSLTTVSRSSSTARPATAVVRSASAVSRSDSASRPASAQRASPAMRAATPTKTPFQPVAPRDGAVAKPIGTSRARATRIKPAVAPVVAPIARSPRTGTPTRVQQQQQQLKQLHMGIDQAQSIVNSNEQRSNSAVKASPNRSTSNPKRGSGFRDATTLFMASGESLETALAAGRMSPEAPKSHVAKAEPAPSRVAAPAPVSVPAAPATPIMSARRGSSLFAPTAASISRSKAVAEATAAHAAQIAAAAAAPGHDAFVSLAAVSSNRPQSASRSSSRSSSRTAFDTSSRPSSAARPVTRPAARPAVVSPPPAARSSSTSRPNSAQPVRPAAKETTKELARPSSAARSAPANAPTVAKKATPTASTQRGVSSSRFESTRSSDSRPSSAARSVTTATASSRATPKPIETALAVQAVPASPRLRSPTAMAAEVVRSMKNAHSSERIVVETSLPEALKPVAPVVSLPVAQASTAPSTSAPVDLKLAELQRQKEIMEAQHAAELARLRAQVEALSRQQSFADAPEQPAAVPKPQPAPVAPAVAPVQIVKEEPKVLEPVKSAQSMVSNSSTKSMWQPMASDVSSPPALASPLANDSKSDEVKYAPALPTDLLFKLDLDVGQGRSYQFNFFRGSDCAGMAYEFASKLGLPSAASQRVKKILEQHLQQYCEQHNPTYDPARPFETGLLPLQPTTPTATSP